VRPALFNAVRAHAVLWLSIAAGFVAAYHALLIGAMIVRFGHVPNFIKLYDIVDAYRLTFSGTPSVLDAFRIAAAEPWLEIGYMSPQWNMAEWSLMILPPQLALLSLVGVLAATFGVVQHAARKTRCARARVSAAIAATVGMGLAGIANATLFWVVCCATPTWIVGLAMLGVSVSVAFALEPAGPLLTSAGLALLGGSTIAQLRGLAPANTASRYAPLPAHRSA
jgi:hypothetical protein